MSDFIKQFKETNTPQFEKYKKYINKKDWTTYSEHEAKVNEFELQNGLIQNIIERLKYFTKKAFVDRNTPDYKAFTRFCLKVIDIHRDRTQRYVDSIDISDIESDQVRSREVRFLKECFQKQTAITDSVEQLGIEEESAITNANIFRQGEIAPLSMIHDIMDEFPEVKAKVESMNIDFDSPPKNELYILIENPPQYNPEKHFWEQDRDTLQFYVDEFKKIKNGVLIDGFYFSGWLYYHLNHFTASYPTTKINNITGEEEAQDIIGVPPLRDNEYFVISDNYAKAKKEGKMLFLAATRRAAKTTMIASHLDWNITLAKKNILCVAGTTKDLGQMEDKLKLSLSKKNPAFRVPVQRDDWSNLDAIYGIKRKNGKNIINSTIRIINLEKGSELESEKLAGFTPDAAVIDEIMKLSFKNQLEALKPALDSPGGKRCVVILSGTAGNATLAKDAFSILSDPEINDILEMPWDSLESYVDDKNLITWTRRPFGTFIPAQMSAKDGLKKLKTNLKEFLKLEHAPTLEKVPMQVTDWEKAKEIIDKDRLKKKKDPVGLVKETLYYPIDPEEMLLSTEANPFPKEEAIRRKQYLIETGKWDRRRDLIIGEDGKLEAVISTRPLAPFPHRGGIIDAPALVFEDIPSVKPPDNLYIASFDDVKQDESETDSLISFQIWKRATFGDVWGGRLVFSWATRPKNRRDLYKKWLALQKAYNAKAFPENEDMGYKSFLEGFHLDDTWLLPSIDFTVDLGAPQQGGRKYGWMPRRDKKPLFGKFISYMEDPVVIGQNEEGDIERIGVQLVDDIGLLDEIINYRDGANVDRISSSLGAVGYMKYLDKNFIYPKEAKNEVQTEIKKPFRKSVLGVSRRSSPLRKVKN